MLIEYLCKQYSNLFTKITSYSYEIKSNSENCIVIGFNIPAMGSPLTNAKEYVKITVLNSYNSYYDNLEKMYCYSNGNADWSNYMPKILMLDEEIISKNEYENLNLYFIIKDTEFNRKNINKIMIKALLLSFLHCASFLIPGENISKFSQDIDYLKKIEKTTNIYDNIIEKEFGQILAYIYMLN